MQYYLSDEWFLGYEKALKKTFNGSHRVTGVSGATLEVYRSCPDGQDHWIYKDWEDGRLVDVKHGVDFMKSPRGADFRMDANYKTWTNMLSLRSPMMDTMMGDEFQFAGALSKFMKMGKPFIASVLMQGFIQPNGHVLFQNGMRLVIDGALKLFGRPDGVSTIVSKFADRKINK